MRGRIVVLTLVLIGAVSGVFASSSFRSLRATLTGYQEVPTLSTSGSGRFLARINRDETAINWILSYRDTESAVSQAHIHLGARALNGPVVVFLCTNLGNSPAQACPASPATITGTITAADVGAGAAGAGLEAGNLAELIAALRANAMYANVHTANRPGGEIRGQISAHHGDDDHN